ncbi:MAG: hypothetical protein IKI56_06135 [Ruminococcus sp.]|nr:hypothetical protein [Ruminococcus sp.]
MRLSLKAGAFIVAPILLVSLVIYIFIPGIFTYIKVKHDYENIDRTIPAFEKVSVPEDFEEYSCPVVVISAPAGMKDVSNPMSSIIKYQKGKQSLLVFDLSGTYDRIGYDPWDNEKYDKKNYRHFFKSIDHDFPSTPGNTLLWFEKDEINAKMCLHLRSKDLKIFKEFAKDKEEAWNAEDTWKYKGDGFTCYVNHLKGDQHTKEMWTCQVYPDYDPYREISFWIKNTDDTTAKQIASSIRLK